MAKTVKQKEADAAFIDKIKTIGITTNKAEASHCKKCGELHPVGYAVGMVGDTPVTKPIPIYPVGEVLKKLETDLKDASPRNRPAPSQDQQSFAA